MKKTAVGKMQQKLRAWDELHKLMVYDSSVGVPGTTLDYLVCQFDDSTVGMMREGDGARLPTTWFTGFYDKNGNPIYEGDVSSDEDGTFFVEWDSRIGCWSVSTAHDSCSDILSNWLEEFVILGNIYEHPHLLAALPSREEDE